MGYNKEFDNLQHNYLFAEVAKRVKAFKKKNESATLINLGIGDVNKPLAPAIVKAGKAALKDMSCTDSFKGYCDCEGYGFLRLAVQNKYKKTGIDIDIDEIFIGDGAKSDMASFLRLFEKSIALITNPVYPAYLDANILAGNEIIFADGNIKNGFLPMPDDRRCDIIYLCSPSNPTGAVYSKAQLKEWVDYAKKTGAVILYDCAYEAYITGNYPHSIFELDGARDCAVEFCSLSKSAGFTGVRCGWTVVPKNTRANALWLRHRSSSYNGTPYIVQRMAEAAISGEGEKQVCTQIKDYLKKAAFITDILNKKGIWHTGGINSPYIWMDCGMDSWDFFDKMLSENNIIGIPGIGFGSAGANHFRLSAYGLPDVSSAILM